ncbi:hypothetical protein [Hymenobacter crusticola]|uniref:Uncharacterized protein n=1 Tax=Hymenobacter crusticola TaxID=1770526 RepID=A0A243W8P3_9BACT|nr:hypothetical protein [Hymenobacter crusticola]OUJ71749.1 hypothetical protein BXP70_20535 [Hymenobacter crusticola]
MGIFGSNNQQSGTMGGLISGLLRTFTGGNSGNSDNANVSRGGGFNRKLAGGALLAAGAAYLYNRSKNKGANVPTLNINR